MLNLNCSPSALRSLLLRRNVDFRSRGKQPFFNENYFENIDDEHKAYWLGFICADGSIVGNCVRIEIHSRDVELLRRLKEDLDSSNKILEIKGEGGFGKINDVAISFTSKKISSDLQDHGVIKHKSVHLKNMPFLPDDLMRHFIRGYFDGNGTVYVESKKNSLRVGFYSTKPFLEAIQKYLGNQIGLSVNKLYEKVGCWLLSYSKKSDIEKIFNYFYSDTDLYMTRKYQKFKENM